MACLLELCLLEILHGEYFLLKFTLKIWWYNILQIFFTMHFNKIDQTYFILYYSLLMNERFILLFKMSHDCHIFRVVTKNSLRVHLSISIFTQYIYLYKKVSFDI